MVDAHFNTERAAYHFRIAYDENRLKYKDELRKRFEQDRAAVI